MTAIIAFLSSFKVAKIAVALAFLTAVVVGFGSQVGSLFAGVVVPDVAVPYFNYCGLNDCFGIIISAGISRLTFFCSLKVFEALSS